MTTATARVGRPPLSRDKLLVELRRRIIAGELPPGSRVPTRVELGRRFRSANPTVHEALQRLIRDGFLETRGNRGTFVTTNPPHLSTYGLVFPRLDHETRFFHAVRSAARAVFNSDSLRLRVYESVLDKPDDPHNLQLVDDIAHHRMAGLITTWEGCELPSLYDSPGGPVPRVALNHTHPNSGIPALIISFLSFFDRAVERLAAQGRRKIAYIGVGPDDRECTVFSDALRRRGMESRPYWRLNIGPLCYPFARTATHLLMSLAPADRPDALIIADDNIVEHAQAGLIEAGIKAPQDLSVVAHCNWPEPPAAVLPLTRLGFDVTAMMRTSRQLIDQMRRGEAPPPTVSITAQFEEELPSNAAALAPAAAGVA